jgi:RHS repeat-associated protein
VTCISFVTKDRWLPYRQVTGWHRSWQGTLVEDKVGTSGLMYRRNRYYDPGTGRFTQEDPIGVAGGLNLYGFANGDPVTYSDPYGLKVVCMNRAACALWDNLLNSALRAARSSDAEVAAAGRHLWGVMYRLQQDDQTLAITVEKTGFFNRWGAYYVPVFNPATATGQCDKLDRLCPRGASFAIRLDPEFSAFANIGPKTRGAHELGHAHARMVDGLEPGQESETQAVDAENSQRTIRGCSVRTSHEHGNTGANCPE